MEKWLKVIHRETNPLYRWANCLARKEVLVISSGANQATMRIAHWMAKRLHPDDDLGNISFLPPDFIQEGLDGMTRAQKVERIGVEMKKMLGLDLVIVNRETCV